MTVHALSATFVRGEISPLAHARADIDTYRQSLALCRNFYVLRYGGVRRRPGTRFRGYAKFADKPARFFPLTISETSAYALEFGHEYIRPWFPAAQTIGGNGGTEIPPVTSAAYNGRSIQIGADDVPYEITSPYTDADLSTLSVSSVNDVTYIAGGNKWPQVLKRYAHTTWTLEDIEFFDGPYEPINTNTTAQLTVTGSPTTGATVTFAWTSGVALGALDVGRQVRAQFRGSWVWGEITAVGTPLTATVLIKGGKDDTDTANEDDDDGDGSLVDADDDIIPSGATSFSWRLGVFCKNNPVDIPRRVKVLDGRIVWAQTGRHPRGVYGTKANYVDVFSPSDQDGLVTDDHGFSAELLSGGADPIVWINDGYRVQLGTASGVRTIGGTDGGVSARNLGQRREVHQGAKDASPIVTGTSVMFLGSGGRRLYDMFYDFNTNSLNAQNVSVLSEHLLASGGVELAFQDIPEGLLWIRTATGELVCVTLEKTEKITGYSRVVLGGNAVVESICALPGPVRDELIMVVRRVVNGATVRTVETMDGPFEYSTKDEAFFYDCGLTLTYETPQSTITGLEHLNGETVSVFADGAALPQRTVTDGSLTLPNGVTASKVSVGYKTLAQIGVLRAPMRTQEGDTLGTRRRVVNVGVDMFETLGLRLVSDTGAEELLPLRTSTHPMGSSPPLFTGVAHVAVDGSWRSEGVFVIACDGPFPATIRALNIKLDFEP